MSGRREIHAPGAVRHPAGSAYAYAVMRAETEAAEDNAAQTAQSISERL